MTPPEEPGQGGGGPAARRLLDRLLGERAAEFTADVVPVSGGPDWYEIDAGPAGVTLRGSSGVAVASALRRYLRTACGTQITWDAPVPRLPHRLPHTGSTARTTSPYRHRYHFNVCTFGYTTAFWDWDRWERHIDWMALHGVTTPLAMTGLEAAWQRALLAAGLDDESARRFLGGPAYLPWNWLASLDGWRGPLPQSWIDGHADLARRILDRERALGMRPVLQGFSGHLPGELIADRGARSTTLPWWDFEVRVLDPRDPLFAEFGTTLLTEQTRLFGTDHLYAADPFIETTPPVGDPAGLARVARAVHGTMTAVDARATWVLQAWPFSYRSRYWTPERTRAFLDAVPDDGLLVLDLWAEHRPVWRRADGFRGKPWVWCMLHNLGGRPGLYGKLDEIATGAARAAGDARGGSLAGTGTGMEAFGGDPVLYELLADVAWQGSVDDVRAWLATWTRARYGRTTPGLLRAWELLHDSVYTAEGPGPPGSVVIGRPTLEGDLRHRLPVHLSDPPSPDVPPGLAEAWTLLAVEAAPGDAAGPLGRDLCDVTAQVLTHRACAQQWRAADAALARDADRFHRAAGELLGTIEDLDTLLATRPEYRLDAWLADARSWATTSAEADLYEGNARRLLTLWGHTRSSLHDYSGRHWSGLLRTFHLPRWRSWCAHIGRALKTGSPFRAEQLERELLAQEERWAADRGRTGRPGPDTTGATLDVVRTLMPRHRVRRGQRTGANRGVNVTVEDTRPDDGPATDSFKHETLRRRLQADIARMRPDEALPTERQLADRYDVSRATARRALQALREDGLVRSVRGVGTFVSHPRITKTSALTSFSEDLRSRGYRPSAELLSAERVEADLHHSTALGVDPGTLLHRIERLRLGDGFPICLETVHLSAERFPDLDESLLTGSLSEALQRTQGVRVVRATQQIRAVNVTGRQARLLGVKEGSAALLVRRTAFDGTGHVVEYGESLCRGDLYEFSLVVTV